MFLTSKTIKFQSDQVNFGLSQFCYHSARQEIVSARFYFSVFRLVLKNLDFAFFYICVFRYFMLEEKDHITSVNLLETGFTRVSNYKDY